MKIRPKTFSAALELVRRGYQLFEDDENSGEAIVSTSDNGVWVIEIWWAYSDSVWRNKIQDAQAWQASKDWYFKKGE